MGNLCAVQPLLEKNLPISKRRNCRIFQSDFSVKSILVFLCFLQLMIFIVSGFLHIFMAKIHTNQNLRASKMVKIVIFDFLEEVAKIDFT